MLSSYEYFSYTICFIIVCIIYYMLTVSLTKSYFTVNGEPISDGDVVTLYGSLGLVKPNNLKMNLSTKAPKFEEMDVKANSIVMGVGSIILILSTFAGALLNNVINDKLIK